MRLLHAATVSAEPFSHTPSCPFQLICRYIDSKAESFQHHCLVQHVSVPGACCYCLCVAFQPHFAASLFSCCAAAEQRMISPHCLVKRVSVPAGCCYFLCVAFPSHSCLLQLVYRYIDSRAESGLTLLHLTAGCCYRLCIACQAHSTMSCVTHVHHNCAGTLTAEQRMVSQRSTWLPSVAA